MEKYLALLKFKFLQSLQFRAEIFLWIILDFTPFFALFFVLRSMYEQQPILRSLTLSDVIMYYFLAALIQGLTSTHFEGWRIEEIRLGKIDFFLTRPLSYLQEITISDIAGKLFYIIVFVPFYLLFFFMLSNIDSIQLSTPNPVQLLSFLLLLIFGYLLELTIATLIVLIGFWFEGSQGLEHFKWIVIALFSGSIVPLEFMPEWLRNIVLILPLQYMYAVPIQIFLGRRQLQFFDIVYIVAFSLLLWLTTIFTWEYAKKRYTSAGG